MELTSAELHQKTFGLHSQITDRVNDQPFNGPIAQTFDAIIETRIIPLDVAD